MAKTNKLSQQLVALVCTLIFLGGSVMYYQSKKSEAKHDAKTCSDGCNLGKEQFNLPQLYVDEIAIMNTIAETLEKAAVKEDFKTSEKKVIADVRVWKDMQRVKAMFTKEERKAASEPVLEKAKPALERLHKAQSKVQFTKGGTPLMQKIKAILDGV